MSKIFEGLDKAAARQIQNIMRQNPKGSAAEKMLLKRYIMTPMVQDFNLSGEEWIGQATKWLAINQNNIKKNYPEVDTSDLIDLATKMYEDFLAMQGQLEEARWKGRIAGGLAGGPIGAILGDQLQKYIDDPEFRQKIDQAFGIDKLKGTNQPAQQVAEPEKKSGRTLSQTPDAIRKREQRAAAKAAQTTDKPATEKPRARVNPQTGALEPVKTDTPKTTKPKTTQTSKVTTPVEPPQTLGQLIGKKGYEPDIRTWRNVGDKASDAAKIVGKTPIGRKLGALGAAAGIVGGIGSQMYAGIEDKFKDLLGKQDDKPAPDIKPAPSKVETPPPAPPQSSQPAVEPESDILGAPGADVSEPNGPIDRDRSTDAVIPQRPQKIEYDQPEMPFENADGISVPQPTGGAVKKVAKTIGKGILPGATALTVADDYKDFQKRLSNKDYAGAALRGVATTTGLIPHFGSQALSLGAEGALAAYDNPKVVKDFFKNYTPTSSIGRGIKEGYSAGAAGGTGLGEGDTPPKAGFNKNPHKVGPGTSKDDYEYKKFIPRDRKEKGEEWAIARDVRNVNSKLGKKKPKELNTGFYKNYLGNRPIREGQELSVQELATISDEALDKAYGYGRSSPGNTFGWQANLMSAAYAKKMIDAGITDIEKISDAIHKGWNVTAQKFVQNPDQFSDTEKLRQAGKLDTKLQQRAKLMKINYAELPDDEQEKDRVVARALLKAITGEIDESLPTSPGGMGQAYRKLRLKKEEQTPMFTPEDKLDELSPKAINAFLDKASAAVRGGRPEPAKINPVTKQVAPPGWKVAAGKVAKPGTAMDHYAKVKAIEPKVPVKEYDANLISQIAAANKIKNPDLIYPGQKIILPSGDIYTVQKGDTLGDIVYNRTIPAVQEPVIAQPKIEVPKAEPRISNRYPDSGISSDSKFVDVRNNPGNLRGTDALRKPGYVLDKAVGFDKNGFAIFANPEDGKEAMRRQLALDALKRGLTGRQLINKYAPPSDNNDTDAYIKNTFGELGLDPDSKISPKDLEKIQRLMVRQEHGKEGMNFYYPERQMVAQVNEMEILQRFLDKNIERGAQKLGQQEKEKAAKEKPVPNPNAEYQGPKSAAYDISKPPKPVDPMAVAIAALPKDIEDAKKLKQAPKESSILKGIKGHKS